MDKQVNFKIKIDTDGAEKVHKVSVDAVDLAENINKVTKAQSELNSEMVNINQLKQSWDNLYQGCQQVAGIVGELTAAYNTQEQAEVKLTTEEIKRRYREAMEKRGMAGSVEIPKEDEQGDDAHHR